MTSKTSKDGSREYVQKWFKDNPEWSDVQNHAKDATSLRTNGEFIFLAKGGTLFVYHISGQEVGKYSLSSWINWEERNSDWFKSYVEQYGPYYSAKFQFDKGEIPNIEENKEKINNFYEEATKRSKDEIEIARQIKDVTEYLKAHEKIDGIDPILTLKGLQDGSIPIPEELGIDSISNYVFNVVSNRISKSLDPKEIIETGQDKREEVIGGLKDELTSQQAQNQRMINFLVDPERGDPRLIKLWEELSDEEKKGMTFKDLLLLRRILDTSPMQETWRSAFDKHKYLLDPEKLNLKPPNRIDDRTLWKEIHQDNPWQAPPEIDNQYNNQRHQLAIGGHAGGSSSYGAVEAERSAAKIRAEEEAIDKFHNQGIQDYAATGQMLNYLQGLNRQANENDAFINEGYNEKEDLTYKQNVFNKDVAEAEMRNATQNTAENIGLHDLLNKEQDREYEQIEQLHSNLLSFFDTWFKIQQGQSESDQKFEALKHQLWKDRKLIEAEFTRLGYEKKALEMKQAEADNDIEKWFGIIATGANIAAQLTNSMLDRKHQASQAENQRNWLSSQGGYMGNSAQVSNDSSKGSDSRWGWHIAPTTSSPGIQGGISFNY